MPLSTVFLRPEHIRDTVNQLLAELARQIADHSSVVPHLDSTALGEGFAHHARAINAGYARMHAAELRRLQTLSRGLRAVLKDVDLFQHQDHAGARSVEALR